MQVIQRTIITLLGVLSITAMPTAHAAVVQSRGVGTAPYSGHSFFGKPKMLKIDENEAITKAEINAIDAYFANQGDAATGNYDSVRSRIDADVSKYVLSYVVLNEQKTDSDITVTLKADINGSLLDNMIRNASQTSQTATANRSDILSIFVARQIGSLKTFKSRDYKRTDTSKEHLGSRGESIQSHHMSVNSHTKDSTIRQSGGSSMQQSSQTVWRLYPSEDLNTAITSVLTRQGYEVVDEAFVEAQSKGLLSIKRIDTDYSNGNDLHPKTLLHMEMAAKKLGIRYIALGTMDMGQTNTDPNNGNNRVGVTVNAKIYDLSGRFPRQAVVVGPEQYFGESSTEQAAQVQALKNAGFSAAKELSGQMQQLGLH